MRWDEMPPHCMDALGQFIEAGLVRDDGDQYKLSMDGWEWYVNMMYYSMPPSQKAVLDALIMQNLRQPGRRMTAEQIVFQ